MRLITTIVFLCAVLTACGGGGSGSSGGKTGDLSSLSAKAITSLSLNNVSGTIDETNKTITVTVPFGTNVTALAATFTTTGNSVKIENVPQTSVTTANNFSTPLIFTVTAADGTTANYTVTVTIALNPAKAITAFSLAGATGTINESDKTVAFILPNGTNVTVLKATFLTSGVSVKVASTTQVSGITPNDFTNPVIYTVTAADGTTSKYSVTVAVAANTAKAISSFALASFPGTIDEANKTIAVILPFGTNVTALVASFNTTGASVNVGGTAQISGTTANNFTTPVSYTVYAADGTTTSYTVTVTIAANSAKAITAFSLAGFSGSVDEVNRTIAVTMPYGTNVTALVATFSTTGIGISVGATVQTSGTTANNFTTPQSYTVTAADNSTASYTVTATVANRYNTVNGGCVKDNSTGLIWEVKTNDGQLRDMNKSYTNFDNPNLPQKLTSGGTFVNPTQAEIDAATNSRGYASSVSATNLCGFNDWRLPTLAELIGIMKFPSTAPNIDTTWFPNTQANIFWTSTPDAVTVSFAMSANFSGGGTFGGNRGGSIFVRLVR